jgi:hypothetical protein
VNVKSCSGGTAWRRKFFRNSRIKGAPVALFEFELMLISPVFVGILAALVVDLVVGLFLGAGPGSHFSMIIVIDVGRIEIIRTILTFPLEFSSHHLASGLS